MTEKKLDIFVEMANADMGNKDFYANLDEDLQKQFSSFPAMRWFSAVSDSSPYRDYTLILTNQVLNMNFWDLTDHPELQWKLMAICGSGQKQRHSWIPMPKRKKTSKIQEYMLQWYPGANDLELEIITKSMNRDDFEQFVKSAGTPDADLKDLLKAYDAENGKPEKPAKAGRAKSKT